MKSFEEPREWLNIWPSFADIAICAMIVFLIYALYLISLLPKQISIETIPGDVSFETGSDELRDDILPELDRVYNDIITRTEWKDSSYIIVVNGHTDNIPMEGKFGNWGLSARRALSVVEYYVDHKRVPPNRIRAIGYGEHKPKVKNNRNRGTPENRRIEIILMKTNDEL